MIAKLNVWLTSLTGEILKAGELAVKDPDSRGALHGQFRYDPEYLESPKAFPLDPVHLPLTEGSFDADRPHAGIHGVFEDSLPDDWGRKIMARRYKLGRTEQRVPHLCQKSFPSWAVYANFAHYSLQGNRLQQTFGFRSRISSRPVSSSGRIWKGYERLSA
ncbi:MAG: HipA N-terminal domain-containing protein [Desulfobulbaceae bacterium]|nr:HipA N-terminal domain-containing protein [Desulfobulbaceae bacterium]